MSCFFVSKPTIDAAVTFISLSGLNLNQPHLMATARKLGQALWTLNAWAVQERYEDRAQELLGDWRDDVASYTWQPRPESAVILHKQLCCLIYQCAEGQVLHSDLFKRLDALAKCHEALRQAPGWEGAPWGLPDDPEPGNARAAA
jgi:hypothetical protein